MIAKAVSIPVIAHGGIGTIDHVTDLFNSGIVDAVAVGSALHYEAIRNFDLSFNSEGGEGNIDFLKSGKKANNINDFKLADLKRELRSINIFSR
jgi:2,4-dienoyl-CoA reductase-like NADH-dependent reductase (Old Yellow Enzyme family)